MKNKQTVNTSVWDKQRGKIRTRKGGWFPGKGVFCHGRNMMEDLLGKSSYMQVVILNATGKMVERRLADWFEATFICLSWPDPRIWCNQIGAFGGAMRTSPVVSTATGIMAGDSTAYGQKTLIKGVEFIQTALSKYLQGESVEDIIKSEGRRLGAPPQIMGFARPLAKGDERVTAMERITKDLGFAIGEHLKLAYEIENYLYEHYNESMNINGYTSAFLSDLGFTSKEVYDIYAFLIASGITACYVDTSSRPPETFLPLRCDDIDYQGPPPREVPNPD